MTEKKLRFGILGCGVIADFHAKAIHSLENATLIGAADAIPASAVRFAAKYGIFAYDTFEDMLADERIDAVCICTPSGFHAGNALTALLAKKHVVLEKPIAFTAAEAKKIADAAEQNGCILTVICQLRFSEDIGKVKKLMEENAFGKIVLCDLYMKYWRSPEYYASNSWRGTLKLDGGGALMNQGIHGVDSLLYLVGDAQVICAKNKTMFHDIEVEDLSVSMLQFENGATGVIEATTCSCPGFERRLEIIGTEGSVVLKENRIERLTLHGETVVEAADVVVSGTASNPTAMDYDLHALQIGNFIDAVLNGKELLINASEGARAVKLIEEIYQKGTS